MAQLSEHRLQWLHEAVPAARIEQHHKEQQLGDQEERQQERQPGLRAHAQTLLSIVTRNPSKASPRGAFLTGHLHDSQDLTGNASR